MSNYFKQYRSIKLSIMTFFPITNQSMCRMKSACGAGYSLWLLLVMLLVCDGVSVTDLRFSAAGY